MKIKLNLASASPRRRELIKKLTFVDAESISSDFDESLISTKTHPEIYAIRLAYEKAKNVYNKNHLPTLGVDTIVVINNQILGKPTDVEDARRILKLLSGVTHKVISGFCLYCSEKQVFDYEETFVTFDSFDSDFIDSYISTGSSFDKAGAYGIQDDMIKSVTKSITGDYYNIVGLPINSIEKLILENLINGSN